MTTSNPNFTSQADLTRWVAAIADNVRNPIASIAAALEVIEREIAARPALAGLAADAIGKARHRLTALDAYVSELREFGEPPVIDRSVVTVRGVIDTALREVRDGLSDDTEIEFAIEPEAAAIYADRTKLVAIVRAALHNAIRAVGAEQALRLRFTGLSVTEPEPGVELGIEDNGPGAPADLRGRVFEPFFSTKDAGTGLGLALAKKYVSAHGGTIALDRSRTLGGARLLIFLPNRIDQKARVP